MKADDRFLSTWPQTCWPGDARPSYPTASHHTPSLSPFFAPGSGLWQERTSAQGAAGYKPPLSTVLNISTREGTGSNVKDYQEKVGEK